MDTWIKNLWKNNKLLFIIAIPLILIVVLRDVIMNLLIGSARKIANKAKVEDSKLKAEEDRLNAEADKKREEADKLGEKADNVEKDENWHKS